MKRKGPYYYAYNPYYARCASMAFREKKNQMWKHIGQISGCLALGVVLTALWWYLNAG